MKISGFTIARNVIKYNYPILESIRSILPICDEFVVNVGDSEDDTLGLIRSLKDPKIRIVENTWDMSQKAQVLSHQTNLALKECKGDWAFYLQSDEVIHEADLPRLKSVMTKNLNNSEVDALRFKWFHFYGSYWRYRIDGGWYQKQDRIVRNNGTVQSMGDAWGFERRDGQPLRRKNTGCFLYHYGWVQPQETMTQRRKNADNIGFVRLQDHERKNSYTYGDLNRFPVYFGTHPGVMATRVTEHALSQEDEQTIQKKFWWHSGLRFRIRYKTWKRVGDKIE